MVLTNHDVILVQIISSTLFLVDLLLLKIFKTGLSSVSERLVSPKAYKYMGIYLEKRHVTLTDHFLQTKE